MSEPTIKASLASVSLGCTLLSKLVRDLPEDQIGEIVGYDEARELDEAVWTMFEYARTQRATRIGAARALLQAHKDNEPDMDIVNASLTAIEEGRTQPIQDIIDRLQ